MKKKTIKILENGLNKNISKRLQILLYEYEGFKPQSHP